MTNLWNLRDPPIPVMSTCKIDDRKFDLHFYRKRIYEAVISFEKQPYLHAEATLLSRYIYRIKTKLRSDHGVKEMQKLNIAVRRYLTLDLPKALRQFLDNLPKRKGAQVYYPTLGNLDYILIRLQGTAKLMIRASECARYCALYMKNRISIGHLWKMAYIALGIVARLFVLSKNVVKVCCSVYNDLLPMREFLSDSSYVGEDYVFPDKLEKWLDEDWLLEETVIEDIVVDVNEKLKRFQSMDDDSDVEICNEYVEIDDDIECVNEYVDITGPAKKSKENDVNNETLSEVIPGEILNKEHSVIEIINNEEEDIGEVISDNSGKDVELDFEEVPRFISQEDDIGEVVPEINKGLTRKELNILKRKSSEMEINERNSKKNKALFDESMDEKKAKKKKREKLGKRDKLEKTHHNSFEIIDAIDRKTSKRKNNLDKISKSNGFAEEIIRKTKKSNGTVITSKNNRINKTQKPIFSLENNETEVDVKPKKSLKNNKNNSSLPIKNVIQSIDSISQLKTFMVKENKMRDVNANKCKLKHLNKMQWNMLNNLVTDFIKKANKNETKSLKFLQKSKDALLMNAE